MSIYAKIVIKNFAILLSQLYQKMAHLKDRREGEEVKMIKILEYGTKQVKTCDVCGCKFSFEKEDIREEDDGIPALPMDNRYKKFVQCPQCHQNIILQVTR